MTETTLSADQEISGQCPHCHEKVHFGLLASIPAEQRLTMTLEHESPFIAAETLGETITNTAKLLSAVAEGIGGKTAVIAVMVESCELTKGKAAIKFVILDVKQ